MRSRRLPNARVNRFCRFHSWMVSQGLACVAGAKRGGGRRRGEGENPLSPIPLPFSFPSLLLSTPVRSSKKYDTHIEWSISVPSLSFASTDKCNSWSNYQLKYLPKRAEILSMYNDQIQRLGGRRTFCFNGMWYLSRFRRKAGLFRSCLSSALFSRSQQSRVGTLLLNAQRKKTIFMKKDLIDIVDPPFIRESADRAVKHI